MPLPCNRNHAGRPDRGFTLLELLVVLTILGLVYALALPSFSGVFASSRLNTATRDLLTALREARATALVSGDDVAFVVDPAARRWRAGDRTGGFDDDVTVTLMVPPVGRYGDGRQAIRFFPDGGATGGKIFLSGSAGRRRIDVHWLTGRVDEIR